MREKERIERILSLIHKEWSKHQDVRFFQLLTRLQYDYADSHNGEGIRELDGGSIAFNNYDLEDDSLEEFLQNWKF